MDVKVGTLKGYVGSMPSGSGGVFESWVASGDSGTKVYRSSQPYYNGGDSEQVFDPNAVKVLKDHKINLIVSLNHKGLAKGQKEILDADKISYCYLGVEDYKAPTVAQLEEGCQEISNNFSAGNALVYCGYGQGRTGTMMTAYQIYSTKKCTTKQLDEFIKASTAETRDQETALRNFYKKLYPNSLLLEA